MWLAYVQETPTYSLTTAVENLAQLFRNLEFDAEHEANCGFERFKTIEECMELARKYSKAEEACNTYLHTLDLTTFLTTIKHMDFAHFLDKVKRKSVREKYHNLKLASTTTQSQLEQTYKPITEPLKQLISTIGEPIVLKEEPFSLKEEFVTPKKKYETSTPSKQRIVRKTGKTPILPSEIPSFFDTSVASVSQLPSIQETTVLAETSPFPKGSTSESLNLSDILEQTKQSIKNYIDSPSYQVYLSDFHKLPRSYIDGSVRDTEHKFDHNYGVVHDIDGEKFFLGLTQKPVKIVGKNIVVEGRTYEGTVGLYELLFKKEPVGFKPKDLDNYMDILKITNAYRRNNDPNEQVQGTASTKYITIIGPYLQKKGITKSKTINPVRPTTFEKPIAPYRIIDKFGRHISKRNSMNKTSLENVDFSTVENTILNNLKKDLTYFGKKINQDFENRLKQDVINVNKRLNENDVKIENTAKKIKLFENDLKKDIIDCSASTKKNYEKLTKFEGDIETITKYHNDVIDLKNYFETEITKLKTYMNETSKIDSVQKSIEDNLKLKFENFSTKVYDRVTKEVKYFKNNHDNIDKNIKRLDRTSNLNALLRKKNTDDIAFIKEQLNTILTQIPKLTSIQSSSEEEVRNLKIKINDIEMNTKEITEFKNQLNNISLDISRLSSVQNSKMEEQLKLTTEITEIKSIIKVITDLENQFKIISMKVIDLGKKIDEIKNLKVDEDVEFKIDQKVEQIRKYGTKDIELLKEKLNTILSQVSELSFTQISGKKEIEQLKIDIDDIKINTKGITDFKNQFNNISTEISKFSLMQNSNKEEILKLETQLTKIQLVTKVVTDLENQFKNISKEILNLGKRIDEIKNLKIDVDSKIDQKVEKIEKDIQLLREYVENEDKKLNVGINKINETMGTKIKEIIIENLKAEIAQVKDKIENISTAQLDKVNNLLNGQNLEEVSLTKRRLIFSIQSTIPTIIKKLNEELKKIEEEGLGDVENRTIKYLRIHIKDCLDNINGEIDKIFEYLKETDEKIMINKLEKWVESYKSYYDNYYLKKFNK
ncbi:unnamed protein product [Ceutorhynchus assimilis]|uniref:DUF8207 domain-containing protein n=1 Tax=Ceutorhynchus assimilis TaxID=467358 RepID=A0A9N9ME58_9CUCU|nr:unnamed protein product [Ceutorhynchus assimilis]